MRPFQTVKAPKPNKSAFDLSHEHKLTLKMGQLIPVMNQEVLPGDRFNVQTQAFIRFQPLIAPIVHRVNCYIHSFYVPYRILWQDWEKFITAGVSGEETPAFPRHTRSFAAAGSEMGLSTLADYLGLPASRYKDLENAVGNIPEISQLPFRAYQRIFNDHYRDQNLQDEIEIPTTGGLVTGSTFDPMLVLRSKNFEKDYFTSALPWAQRGPQAHLPIEGQVRIDDGEIRLHSTSPISNITPLGIEPENMSDGYLARADDRAAVHSRDWMGTLEQITASINDVRRMFSVQRWFEKSARFGSKYEEIMFSHFGVKPSDSRINKAEYLGGGKIPVQIADVVQTMSQEESPLGAFGGHATTAGMHGFNHSFPEHGIVMSIMCVLPRTAYFQGINKMWNRFDKFDYYWPDFANLGEQEVKEKELFLSQAENHNEMTFGYQERYAEYRTATDRLSGDMQNTLLHWHLARKFANRPGLNEDFIRVPHDARIFAVQDEEFDNIIAQVYNKVTAIRPIPKFGNPR